MANESSTNPWFGISMALFGVIVGYFAALSTSGFSAVPAAPSPTPTAAQPTAAPTAVPTAEAKDVPPITDRDYVRGNPNAPISIIEYSDFECPFCSRHHPTMQAVLEQHGDDVNWVYRHFPLSFHPNAQPAAEASECVGQLGGNDKFWEYADILFAEGSDASALADKAERIGIDRTAFEDCMNSGTYTQYVNDQMQAGGAAGVTGTPGNIVINNETGETRLVSGAQPAASFDAAISALQ